jgi:hypothetical protein
MDATLSNFIIPTLSNIFIGIDPPTSKYLEPLSLGLINLSF